MKKLDTLVKMLFSALSPAAYACALTTCLGLKCYVSNSVRYESKCVAKEDWWYKLMAMVGHVAPPQMSLAYSLCSRSAILLTRRGMSSLLSLSVTFADATAFTGVFAGCISLNGSRT